MSSTEGSMSSAGAKSVMSDDMQNLTAGKEDISNAARGHKANISNPSALRSYSCEAPCPLMLTHASDTSEKSKENSRKELERLGGEQAFYGKQGDTTSNSAKENLK